MKPALMRLRSAISQHQTSAHLPVSCLIHGKTDCAALQVAGAEGDPADVVREEAAVGANAGKFAIDVGQAPQGAVDAVLVVVDVGGQPVQLGDGAGEGRAAPAPSRSASDAVPLSSDSMAVPIGSRSSESPWTSLLEPVDRTREVGAVFGQGVQHGSQVVDQLLDHLVVVGDRVGERRRTWRTANQACRPDPAAPGSAMPTARSRPADSGPG